MKTLVIGSGGREHAIVEALSRSPQVTKIYCAPGNAGISRLAECVNIGVTDIEALADFAEREKIDLTVVGPEAALAAGIVNLFNERGLKIFGPTKEAARIESSKEYAKQVMERFGVPTAGYRAFDNYEDAIAYVKAGKIPTVIKYDGLAAGKGVVVAMSLEEADAALRDMLLDSSFGKGRVVIEDFLEGPEFSFMCVVSGDKVYPLELAQDHKRAYDGDKGPNTGGMGAYSPVPFIGEDVKARALKEIMEPVAKGLVSEGNPFTGILYGGLILTEEGPKVIEFNARFGDPETEVVLPRMKSDIYALFNAALKGEEFDIEWDKDAVLGVVLASKGYPGSYAKGAEIKGLDDVETSVYHMGTTAKDGKLLTAGGRVLMVTGKGATLEEAHAESMKSLAKIECASLFHRSDIGKAAL
ncbi:MAG: phosphoribosylamine--glycine ligase [Muribaculaceae bacterium]|nr:phosphoribosylamine--glycine ligase [Muribaculaceae bacterium]